MKSRTKELVEQAIAQSTPSTHGWWRAPCPICTVKYGKDDKRKSLGFFPETGQYHCFRCRISGLLYGDFYSFVNQNPDESDDEQIFEPPEGFMLIGEEPAISAISAKEIRDYLLKRNVPEQTWREAHIGFTFEGEHHHRIIVPAIYEGEWWGWTARDWTDKSYLPYLYPYGMKREMLWNQEILEIETDRPAIVVEGVFDALPHWPDTTACLAKPTREQIKALKESRRPLVIALDGDSWSEARSLAMLLRLGGLHAEYLRLPPKTDPGDIEPGGLMEMAQEVI